MRCKQTISLILVIGCLTLLTPQRMYAQEGQDEIKVEQGTTLILELLSPISTATNQKGDSFSCRVSNEGNYAGATIGGYIKSLKRSGKANKKSEMNLAFDSITMPDGRSGGFNAQIVEVYEVAVAGNDGRADTEGTVKAKSRVRVSVKRAIAGALIGAVIGGIIAGGQGAAAGAAIGASVGVTSALATDGPDLEFKQGTQFKVLTNAPARRNKSSRPAARTEAARAPVLESPQAPAVEATTDTSHQTAATPVPAPGVEIVEPLSIQPSRPPTPKAPSTNLRTYAGGGLFRLSIPANWRESSDKNPVTLAPDGGYIFYQGQLALTHGIRIGVQSSQNQNLQQASELLVNSLIQARAYLHQQSGSQKSLVAGRDALMMIFSGESPVSKGSEVMTLYTTLLRNGDLFYVLTVAPQDQYRDYEGPFQNVIRTIQINE
ncbi:MAG TPA: hypothetical protein VGX92_12485 [Pyrinomonadaceae bacterium]|nr:hypothetical protein [Pyrinomonadaceae bacterium]